MVNKRSHSVTQDTCFIYVCACVFEKKKVFFLLYQILCQQMYDISKTDELLADCEN